MTAIERLGFAACFATAATLFVATTASGQSARVNELQLRLESRFWPNLHQFLYLLAQPAAPGSSDRSTVRAVIEDGRRRTELTAEERAAWDVALAYYQQRVARLSPWDELAELNALLVTADDTPPSIKALDGLTEVLAGAASAYRRIWWPSHDAANRRWIDEQRARQSAHGAAVATRLSAMFRSPWPEAVIPVQIVAYATMFGAFQQDRPLMLHMSSTYDGHAGTLGFEQLLHESGHTLDDGILTALRAEAKKQGNTQRLGRWIDLTHAILFYTAGDAVRRSIADHTPYAEAQGVWRRQPDRPLLVAHWQPYLSGEISFEEAIERLVRHS